MATQPEPEFAEVERGFDLRDHLEPVGFFDGTDVFMLRDPVEEESPWYRKTWRAGLYFLDDCEWCCVAIDYQVSQHRERLQKARTRAAKLANDHPGTAEEFTAKADAIFRFLIKE
jgi:hypothetical protein